MKTKMNC